MTFLISTSKKKKRKKMEKEMAEIKEEENEARITMNCTQHFEDFVRCNCIILLYFNLYF